MVNNAKELKEAAKLIKSAMQPAKATGDLGESNEPYEADASDVLDGLQQQLESASLLLDEHDELQAQEDAHQLEEVIGSDTRHIQSVVESL